MKMAGIPPNKKISHIHNSNETRAILGSAPSIKRSIKATPTIAATMLNLRNPREIPIVDCRSDQFLDRP